MSDVAHPDAPDEPRQYVVAHLQRALAEDPRLHALDVRVKIVGDKVMLTGTVETPERRAAVEHIARAHAENFEIFNEVKVMTFEGPPGEEDLS